MKTKKSDEKNGRNQVKLKLLNCCSYFITMNITLVAKVCIRRDKGLCSSRRGRRITGAKLQVRQDEPPLHRNEASARSDEPWRART